MSLAENPLGIGLGRGCLNQPKRSEAKEMLCKTYSEVLQFFGTGKVQAKCPATSITEVLRSLSWVRCVTIFHYGIMVWSSLSQRYAGPSTVVPARQFHGIYYFGMIVQELKYFELLLGYARPSTRLFGPLLRQSKYCGTGSAIPWDPPRHAGAQWAAKSRQKWSHTNICSLGPFCRKYRNTKWRNTNCKKSGYIRTYILGRVLTEIQKWSQTFLHRLTVKWIRITPKTIYQVAVMDRLWLPVEVVMLFWSLGVQVTK